MKKGADGPWHLKRRKDSTCTHSMYAFSIQTPTKLNNTTTAVAEQLLKVRTSGTQTRVAQHVSKTDNKRKLAVLATKRNVEREKEQERKRERKRKRKKRREVNGMKILFS